MAYQFVEWEHELEPQASMGRWGGPPRKSTLAGVIDAPTPPKRPIGPLSSIPISIVLRVCAMILLAGVLASIMLMLFGHH